MPTDLLAILCCRSEIF